MELTCSFCGGSYDRYHHPTGRDHLDRYLDEQLVLPTDHSCHEFIHDDWRREELNEASELWKAIEYVAVRLRRLAMTLGRIDQHLGRRTFWGALAEVMQRWADGIDAHVGLLDELFPSWRDEGRFDLPFADNPLSELER